MFNPEVKPAALVAALGGEANIVEARCCVTRLRVVIRDTGVVHPDKLKKAGARGVVTTGDAIQIIIGADANKTATTIQQMLEQHT